MVHNTELKYKKRFLVRGIKIYETYVHVNLMTGISHGDSTLMLIPLFPGFYIPKNEGDSNYRMSKDMIKLLVDFAKEKDPKRFN